MTMTTQEKTILVCGIGEIASATARRLAGEGYAVAIHQETPPATLRRLMSFSDAWFDVQASLDGFSARRADTSSEFLLGLQTGEFVPILTQRFIDVTERWPWDIIVATAEDGETPPEPVLNLAEFTIGVGPDFQAGTDCHVAIQTEGRDPGAIVREGAPLRFPKSPVEETSRIIAEASGVFRARQSIGSCVRAGDILGEIGDAPVYSPVAGRIKGLARKELAVRDGTAVAEICRSDAGQVAGMSERSMLIARGVAFAIEAELQGWTPLLFENWL